MSGQYSFSNHEVPPEPYALGTVLAIDTGSPVVSVALSASGQVLAERATEQRQSSGRLLQMVDEVLEVSGLELPEVDLLLGLRGPGSFTGLRIGLATLQGMKMALGIDAGTLPTLQILATLAPTDSARVTACVDALQGRWLIQQFASAPAYLPIDEPALVSSEDLLKKSPGHFVGFGIAGLRAQLKTASSVVLVEPGPLAPQALRVLHLCPPDRNPELLASPLYLRAPTVTRKRQPGN